MKTSSPKRLIWGRTFFPAFFMAFFLMVFHTPGRAEVVDRIVAVINNEIITLHELRKDMAPFVMQLKNARLAPEDAQKELYKIRESVLERMINDKLSNQEARRLEVQVSDSEVDSAIENFKKSRMLTDEQLRAFLERDSSTMEEYRKGWRNRILRNKLVNWEVRSKIVITDKDIREYYDAQSDAFAGKTKYHLKNLAAPLTAREDEAGTQKLRQRLESARELLIQTGDFSSVLEKVKQDGRNVQGGDLGFFEASELDPVLRDAVKGMKPGQASPVLETGAGLQVLWVEALEETGGRSLEEAREEIQNEIYREIIDKRYAQWLEKLREGAFIKKIR